MDRDARAALDALIQERREDYASLSRMLGRNPAYIQQFIKRGVPKKLDEEDRSKLARYFGVSETLLGGRDAAADDLIAVPVLDVQASAGAGAFAESERAKARMRFDPSWLRGLTLDPRQLSVIQVTGDSMHPTLNDGDDILVDRGDRRLRDGIYVLRMDGALNVKRLLLEPGRRVTVRSDNPAYPSWPSLERSALDVIGRVVWAGRRLV
ncbi:helix-turn-helix transcriptional regulator [Sphingomonas sp. ID1715]|uniref:S24 family peptidase n=1 Tax=Sphingomonas sp. ID1715 TaxID=1656898 RepID=UPI00148810B5|nr:helix-turn-helix transcriptional regulator [Sphingomonas sp. ID1715]NNM78256.1 helix-turn-helix transcriptional regulator [Sphingomonas sp. ID1715]